MLMKPEKKENYFVTFVKMERVKALDAGAKGKGPGDNLRQRTQCNTL